MNYDDLKESQKSKLISSCAMVIAFFVFSMALGWFWGFGFFLFMQAIGFALISWRMKVVAREEQEQEAFEEFVEKVSEAKRKAREEDDGQEAIS